jgi:hypothetical protein
MLSGGLFEAGMQDTHFVTLWGAGQSLRRTLRDPSEDKWIQLSEDKWIQPA